MWAWSRSSKKGINVIGVPISGYPAKAQRENHKCALSANLPTGIRRANTSSKRVSPDLSKSLEEGKEVESTDAYTPVPPGDDSPLGDRHQDFPPFKAASESRSSQTFASHSQVSFGFRLLLHCEIPTRFFVLSDLALSNEFGQKFIWKISRAGYPCFISKGTYLGREQSLLASFSKRLTGEIISPVTIAVISQTGKLSLFRWRQLRNIGIVWQLFQTLQSLDVGKDALPLGSAIQMVLGTLAVKSNLVFQGLVGVAESAHFSPTLIYEVLPSQCHACRAVVEIVRGGPRNAV